MAELTVDKTYGTALYDAAKDLDRVDSIQEEAEAILEIFKREKTFYSYLKNPAVSAAEKKGALKNVFSGRISQEMLNFLYVLEDKGRFGHYERIVKAYIKLRDEEEGKATGVAYSVVPLKQEQLEKLQEQASKLLSTNVVLRNEIDKSLIGGVKVLVNGRLIDASLKKRLEDLTAAIKS